MQQFSIDSGEIKQVPLMFKTFRSTPLANDTNITITGAPAPAWDGAFIRIADNCFHLVSVRIVVPEIDAIELQMKVWSDDVGLYAERI
jgi:hypothetical protein